MGVEVPPQWPVIGTWRRRKEGKKERKEVYFYISIAVIGTWLSMGRWE